MKRTMCALICNAAAVAMVTAAAIIPNRAAAQTPTYAGTWGSQPAQCRLGQESQDAPMVVRRDGYDQHEAHCKFSSIRAQGPTWAVKARCTVEGDTQNLALVLRVSGNRLTIRDDAGARTLQRCK